MIIFVLWKNNNKYYTPTIEEFHVGFEYEFNVNHKTGVPDNWVPMVWYINDNKEGFDKKYFDNLYHLPIYYLPVYPVPECVRVKYLDKEDIESLGWEDWQPMGMSCYRINHNNKHPNGEFQLYFYDNNWITIYNDDSQFVFQGTIKNKSELKKLMKQLGIYE